MDLLDCSFGDRAVEKDFRFGIGRVVGWNSESSSILYAVEKSSDRFRPGFGGGISSGRILWAEMSSMLEEQLGVDE